MNPTVCRNPINSSTDAQWRWGLILLLEKEQSSPSVFKAVFIALAFLFALILKRFHLPAISHSSPICFVHFTSSSGEMSPHGSAPKWSECSELWRWAQQSKNGSLDRSLVLLRSDPGTVLCLTQVLPAACCLLRSSGSTLTEWMSNSRFC